LIFFFCSCFFVISSFNIIFIQKISFFVFFNFFSISLLWSPEMECRFDRWTRADSILIVMVTYLSCYLRLIRHVLFLFFLSNVIVLYLIGWKLNYIDLCSWKKNSQVIVIAFVFIYFFFNFIKIKLSYLISKHFNSNHISKQKKNMLAAFKN
jgi:hypothetical protein